MLITYSGWLQPDEGPASQGSSETAGADEEALQILLVEDNPGDVDLVRLYLAQDQERRIELHCAESLAAAAEALTPEGPDLVLLDLGLPDGTGVEVIGAMRRLVADVPIVVLTGQDDPRAGVEAMKSEAQDFLMKDRLNASALSRSIQYALERHRWQQRYHHQLSSSPDGIIVLGSDGGVRFANAAAASLLGGVPEHAAELPAELTREGDDPADVTLATGRIVETRRATTDWQGEAARLLTLRDMTERRQAEEALSRLTEELKRTNARLEELVSTDPLTQVLNRRGVEEALSAEIDRAHRTGDTLIAVLSDCDDFKGVNDSFGHAVGDAALTALTESVRGALRAGDHVGRVGGDEFMVLLPGTTLAEGMAVAEKLRQAIKSTTLPVADGHLQLSASLAVGVVEPGVISLEQVLASVHGALKRSKGGGKDRVATKNGSENGDFSDQELHADSIALGVALQTIRRIDTQESVGHEALLRGPPGFYAMPADLFRAAFEQNVLTTLDLRALSASIDRLKHENVLGWYHINVFPSTVLNTPADRIVDLLGEASAAGRLCVELSEQQFLGDPTYLREPLATMRDSGVRVAIDDVGFGRSSIEALMVLEPDVVKVDRRCIQSISTHVGDRRRLEKLMGMLDAVGADVIVEGVESEDELDILRNMGVMYAQGFLWDEPTRVFEEGKVH